MSRHVISTPKHLTYQGVPVRLVALGFDHAVGYLIQVYSYDEDERLLLGLDRRFDGLTNDRLLEVLAELEIHTLAVVINCETGKAQPFECVKGQIVLDLPF